jgi:methylglutaconyl-CoA hydratase
MLSNPSVEFAINNGVARITINRPARRNALSAEAMVELGAAFTQAAHHSSVRAIVLTGTGDRAFCAGGDLTGGTEIFVPESLTTHPLGNLLRLIRHIEKPIVGRINGSCMAGGIGLLAACDLAIAADHASFGLPEARIGMFPMQVVAVLQPLLRPRDLYELCLCAEPIDAHRALAIGLVNRVVPAAELDGAIDIVLASLLSGAPSALRRGKYLLTAIADMNFEQAIAFAEGQVTLQASTDDAREGVSAFNEKRLPNWVQP